MMLSELAAEHSLLGLQTVRGLFRGRSASRGSALRNAVTKNWSSLEAFNLATEALTSRHRHIERQILRLCEGCREILGFSAFILSIIPDSHAFPRE